MPAYNSPKLAVSLSTLFAVSCPILICELYAERLCYKKVQLFGRLLEVSWVSNMHPSPLVMICRPSDFQRDSGMWASLGEHGDWATIKAHSLNESVNI